MKRASLWRPLPSKQVQCRLCSHFCLIAPGETGKCGVRCNQQGELQTLVDAKVAAAHLDPVEKKPLFHYLPGTTTFSFGTVGCNMTCAFCQNASLSDTTRLREHRNSGDADCESLAASIPGQSVTPRLLVDEALASGAASVAFTYSEPTVFYELMTATADLGLDAGLGTILVSNGFQSREALESLRPRIRAANIDLKAFTESFYHDVCGAALKPVLDNLQRMVSYGWWLEITTLVIPGLNDSDAELQNIARFIHDSLGPHVPWHISRFHPAHRLMDREITPRGTLDRACRIGRDAGLWFVYPGNIPGHPCESTMCPSCGALFAERRGFSIIPPERDTCSRCGTRIPGVGWTKEHH